MFTLMGYTTEKGSFPLGGKFDYEYEAWQARSNLRNGVGFMWEGKKVLWPRGEGADVIVSEILSEEA